MKTKITGKDIFITIAVLLVIFGGTPFLFWGISSWRLSAIQKKVEVGAMKIFESHLENARKTGGLLFEKSKLSSSKNPFKRWFWQERVHNESSRVYELTEYATTIQAIRGLCTDAESDLVREFRLALSPAYSYSYMDHCSFILKTQDGYGEASPTFVGPFTDSVDIKHLEKLTAQSSGVPLSVHRDGRTFHILMLVQKEPLMVWQLRVQTMDYPNDGGKGDF